MNPKETFDLNINNYTVGDLIQFFKLNSLYSIEELSTNETKMIQAVTRMYQETNPEYLMNIKQFITTGKHILQGRLIREENPNITRDRIPSALPKLYNNIGKIINPSGSVPALQKQSIPSNSSNGYNIRTNITNYVFNTRFRDNYFGTLSENSTFTLCNKIKNVLSMSLSGMQVPNVGNTYSSKKETNQLYISEDETGNNAIVEIPAGNYTLETIVPVLEECINIQVLGSYPNRFLVTVNPAKNLIIISNTTYTFTINIVKKKSNPEYIFSGCKEVAPYTYANNNNTDNVDPKKKIKPTDFYTTMGYLIGFRKIEYRGRKSYVTEAPMEIFLQDYYYFEIDDFLDSHCSNTIGVLPTYMIDKNIIAVLPITTPKYVSSFDNNSNFVYKVRTYNGPVDIGKIQTKLLSDQGALVDLHFCDFSFVLQVETVYDNLMSNNTIDVSIL